MKRRKWAQTRSSQQKFRDLATELRQRQTKSESLLWEALRNRKLGGRKFRRQVPIGMFILDFYCVEELLAIEVDGSIHETRQEPDKLRQETLETLGIRFLRFTAEQVEKDLPNVLITIKLTFAG